MKVYFYHTQNIQYCLSRMQQGEFPSHFLYGACHLSSSGIDVVYHRSPSKEMSAPQCPTTIRLGLALGECSESSTSFCEKNIRRSIPR